MPDLANLFNLLKEDGAAKGLSKTTGISSGNICDWKIGRSKPNTETLVMIADYFFVPLTIYLDVQMLKK